MKYSIIFAATAAAAYDAYGAGNHGDSHSITKVDYPTTKVDYPTTSVYGGYDKPAIKTITPGYGKPPVTITTNHQPYPTCAGSKDGKSCDKWNDDVYVSTVIKDCDGKDVTVTKTEQVVTIYRTKATMTNYATPTPTVYKKDDFLKDDCTKDTHYNTTPDYKTACDKSIVYKNYDANCKSDNKYNTTPDYKNDCDKSFEYKKWCATNDKSTGKPTDEKKEWYSLYEKSFECSYADLGPHALEGYPGSGLRKDLDHKQPVYVREYKDGKWSEYKDDLEYGTPEEVKTYEKPGVYTNPSKDIYVDHPITKGSEAYTTAKAGTPVTYGGAYTEVEKPCTITGAYGAYETSVSNGKTITSTVVKTTTVYCAEAGKCEIAKPTTTVYNVDTEFAYPTAKVYQPGVYHYDAETITITKPNQPYTCDYKQTKTYDAPKETGSHGKGNKNSDGKHNNGGKDCNGYDCNNGNEHKPSSTPSVNTMTYPHGGNNGYGNEKPSSTPSVNTMTYPHGGDYGHGNEKPSSTPSVNTMTYPHGGNNGYGNEKPSSTPSVNTMTYPHGGDNGYGNEKPSSTLSVSTVTYPNGGDNGYGHASSSTPAVSTKTYPHGGDYGHGNEKPSSTSCTSSTNTVKTDYPSHSTTAPSYPTTTPSYPTTTPSYNNDQPTYGSKDTDANTYAPAANAGDGYTTPDAPVKRSFGGSLAARALRAL